MVATISSLILLLLITIASYIKYKDILSAPFVLSSIYFLDFLFFVIFKIITKSNFWLNSYALYFVIGQLVFFAGYDLIYNNYMKNCSKIDIDDNFSFSFFYKVFIIIQILLVVIYIFHVLYSTKDIYGFNLLYILSSGKSKKYSEPYVFSLFRTMSFALSFLSVYFLVNNSIDFADKKWGLLQILISIIMLIFNLSRQWIFIFIIPIIFIVIKSKKHNFNNNILRNIMVVLIFLIIIAIQTIIVNKRLDIEFIRLYLNSSIVSFTEWVSRPFKKLYGQYTFRIIFAILKRIGLYNGIVQYMPMEYLNVPNLDWKETLGNVYTFYYGFVSDFGIVYGLIMQFIIAMFHGLLYKLCNIKNNAFYTVLCAVFYMPLIVHFFMEHYVSHVSLWVQMILILLIACKTNIFYENKTT